MFVCSLQNLKENQNQMNLKFHDCWYYYRSALLLRQRKWASTGGSSSSVQWRRRGKGSGLEIPNNSISKSRRSLVAHIKSDIAWA